jgi:monoamine oxidase
MPGRSSPAARMLARAQAATAYARRTGCGIEEAGEVLRETEGRPESAGQPETEGQPAGSPAAGRPAAGRPADAADGRGELSRRAVLGGAGSAALGIAIPAALAQPAARASGTGHRPRVVIIGSGLAGLGCADRLWRRHGIVSEIYEYNPVRPGGRVYTLRGFFEAGQTTEQHGEFISSEHTAMRALSARLGLTLDNVNRYPPHTHPADERLRFDGRFWSQAALNREWHDWAWKLFRDAANNKAPWPTLHNHSTYWGRRWDHMPATHWIEENIHGGLRSDFGRLCVSVLLDEYGGPADEQSALNLIYLLGLYDSSASGLQPRRAPQLSGSDEKWHVRGGNDQLISGLVRRLPAGTVRLGHQLVALRGRGHGRYTATFACGQATREVNADHVVLALPFTRLREVHLHGIDLPALQRRAIQHEPLGSNSKIQLQFSRRVWNADGWTGDLYNDGVVQGGWETTIDQRGTPGILIALPGGVAGADIGRRYGLRSYHGSAPAAMIADFLDDFETMFPGARAAFNGKAFYTWSSGDPHIGGAYSYLKVGQYTSFNGAQSRRHGNLHFAGEQTSVNFQGYMEGALRSGYRCAEEIPA